MAIDATQPTTAAFDPLTGLYDMRTFRAELERRFVLWRDKKTPLALLMFDIDHFKYFHDSLGRHVADKVLRHVAGLLRETMRDVDVLARLDRERFAVILPGITIGDAKHAAERIRTAVEAGSLPLGDNTVSLSLSVGVAHVQGEDDEDRFVARVEKALMSARQAGRNRGYFHEGRKSLPLRIKMKVGGAAAPAGASAVERDVDEKFAELDEFLNGDEQESESAAAPGDDPAAATTNSARGGAWLRRHPRYDFRVAQGMAPYMGGRIPSASMFKVVECLDISSSGFSFVAEETPKTNDIVVEFGAAPKLTYLSARIMHCTPFIDGAETRLKVGCQFTGRLHI